MRRRSAAASEEGETPCRIASERLRLFVGWKCPTTAASSGGELERQRDQADLGVVEVRKRLFQDRIFREANQRLLVSLRKCEKLIPAARYRFGPGRGRFRCRLAPSSAHYRRDEAVFFGGP